MELHKYCDSWSSELWNFSKCCEMFRKMYVSSRCSIALQWRRQINFDLNVIQQSMFSTHWDIWSEMFISGNTDTAGGAYWGVFCRYLSSILRKISNFDNESITETVVSFNITNHFSASTVILSPLWESSNSTFHLPLLVGFTLRLVLSTTLQAWPRSNSELNTTELNYHSSGQ